MANILLSCPEAAREITSEARGIDGGFVDKAAVLAMVEPEADLKHRLN